MLVIRLKEVAADAGVSISTAAAALRGEGTVNANTRKRVEASAKRLGYRKNTAAALMSRQSNRGHQKAVLCAWLTAYPNIGPQPYPWHMAVRHARAAADEAGVLFDHFNIANETQARQVLRQLTARGFDGIVAGRNPMNRPPGFPWDQFCVITTEQALAADGFDVVRSNFFRSTLGILLHLRRSGYSRIGVCLREHTPRHPDDEARYGGTVAFLDLHVDRAQRIPPLRLSYRCPDAEKLMETWINKYKPQIVIGSNEEELFLIERAGFQVPGQISYAALHVVECHAGHVAGLQHNEEVIPRVAISALFEKMRHGLRGLSPLPREIVVAPPFLPGSSCPGV